MVPLKFLFSLLIVTLGGNYSGYILHSQAVSCEFRLKAANKGMQQEDAVLCMMSGNINSIIRVFVSEGRKIKNASPGGGGKFHF